MFERFQVEWLRHSGRVSRPLTELDADAILRRLEPAPHGRMTLEELDEAWEAEEHVPRRALTRDPERVSERTDS
jgi:hypothetical protein